MVLRPTVSRTSPRAEPDGRRSDERTYPVCPGCGVWLGAVGWVVGVDDLVAGVGFGDGVAAVVDVVVA